MDRGGGQVVSVLAFYSENSSSNSTEAYVFFCKICVWKEWRQKQKEAGVGPFKKTQLETRIRLKTK